LNKETRGGDCRERVEGRKRDDGVIQGGERGELHYRGIGEDAGIGNFHVGQKKGEKVKKLLLLTEKNERERASEGGKIRLTRREK